MKNKRIIGIDVARALAIIGMIVVNFKIAFGANGNEIVEAFAKLFEGKAAATFVVLAGIGMAFMTNSAVKNNDKIKINKSRINLAKRALFFFIVGLLYTPIWLADILHFYGIYMLITACFIHSNRKIILGAGLLLILVYPLLMLLFSYDAGWNFTTFVYSDFWSFSGFFRNLFFNGFHPVVPWCAFMLLGLWFGKQDLSNEKFLKRSLIISSSIFTAMLVISKGLIYFISGGNSELAIELAQVLGTSPMPPLPIYMISASAFAIFIISLCVLVSQKFKNNKLIVALNKTGQLALTFYVAHVIIGMGVIEAISPEKMGQYSIEFSMIYAFSFSLLCIVFANIWTKYKSIGPLEWMMRKISK